jgi:hypothetical protein
MRESRIATAMALSSVFTLTKAAPCTVCKHGLSPLVPEKSFAIPGINLNTTCGALDSLIESVIPNEFDPTCQTIQSLGAICECPGSIRETSCRLCPQGNPVNLPTKELFIFKNLFGGFVPTCEIFEAYLLSTDADESLCSISQSFLAFYCGCDESTRPDDNTVQCSFCSNGEKVTEHNKVMNITGFPSGLETCGDVEVAVELLLANSSSQCNTLQSLGTYCGCEKRSSACSLCRDGSKVAFPDKHVEFFKNELGGITPTCSILESYVESYDVSSDQCATFQLGSSICGCPPIENHCSFCPEEGFQVPESYREKPVVILNRFLGFTPTCEVAFDFQYQLRADDFLCWSATLRSDVCGCNGGVWDYMNADTEAKKIALAWLPRVAALLSLIVRRKNQWRTC